MHYETLLPIVRDKSLGPFYRHIRGITWFIWWFPSLLAIGNYCYVNLEELKGHPLPQVYFIGGFLLLLAWWLTY